VRKDILTLITPSQEEVDLQADIINQLRIALEKRAESEKFRYSFIEAEGSTGKKQTQLKGAADIDLFVALNPKDHPGINDQKVVDTLMSKLVSKWFEPAVRNLKVTDVQRAFSQHPFLSLKMNGIDVDILGCFDLDAETIAEKGPITAVDRTIHHTHYIAERMNDRKREDARILKSFVKACHAYGDTCAVGRMGLTGVTLEIIVLNTPDLESSFNTLYNLDSEPLDPEERPLDDLKKIPTFRDDILFLIDPTDYSRNMAASFSDRSYRWVKNRIDNLRTHLKEGNVDEIVNSLIQAPISSEDIPSSVQNHSCVQEFEASGKVHYTILRDKLHRLARKIMQEMSFERTGESRFGEILTEVYFKDRRYALGLFVERPIIPATFNRRGPPVTRKDAVRKFREAHQDNVFERDGFLYVKEKRTWTSASKLFKSTIKKNTIKGLDIQNDRTILGNQVLRVLHDFILPIEPTFAERITRVKDE